MISQLNVPKHNEKDGEVVGGGSTVVTFMKLGVLKGSHPVFCLTAFNLLYIQYCQNWRVGPCPTTRHFGEDCILIEGSFKLCPSVYLSIKGENFKGNNWWSICVKSSNGRLLLEGSWNQEWHLVLGQSENLTWKMLSTKRLRAGLTVSSDPLTRSLTPYLSLLLNPGIHQGWDARGSVLAQKALPGFTVWPPLPHRTLTIQYHTVVLQSSESNPQCRHSQEFIILTEACDGTASHFCFLENCQQALFCF